LRTNRETTPECFHAEVISDHHGTPPTTNHQVTAPGPNSIYEVARVRPKEASARWVGFAAEQVDSLPLAFGIVLGAAATVLLGLLANWLSAALVDAAILLFAFICTLRLKRGSPSGFVIGGAVGCFPVLVGWSAVTGTLSFQATAAAAD